MLSITLLTLAASVAAPDFDTLFTGRCLRFDYHHAGTAGEEHVCFDKLRLEGEWPGRRGELIDDTNLGKYLFRVVDPSTNRTIYSRGFASIYGEWETTGEARGSWRVFHESQRLPEPRARVQLVLEKRADDGGFREIFSTIVDPASRQVIRTPIASQGTLEVIEEHAPPSKAVDLLMIGEGYRADQAGKFHDDVLRLSGVLLDTEPFRTHREQFNVRALHLPSPEAGISNPRAGVWHNTPLDLSFNAFDSDRYVLTWSNEALREAAAQAPYDAIILVFNDRKYGGGGIFNLWSTCAADSEPAPYLVVHEFGHSFAGLADEYYTSQVSYEEFNAPGVEPWEPNITALLEPEHLKWGAFVDPSTPLPTPWDQAAYDAASYDYQEKRAARRAAGASEEEMEELFREVKAVTKPMLEANEYFGKVGAFEGGGYQAKGIYRPEVDCIMFTRNPTTFCRVCSAAIERVIELYTR